MRCRTQLVVALIGAGFALLAAPPAVAQDALGRGDILDANLNQRLGARNAPATRLDFRQRNLLITGDVAGGRGFRGSVGYDAEGDFRGGLGSNDLFSFRADSALSSLSSIQYGAQGQDLRFGQTLGLLEYRRVGAASAAAPAARADDLADVRLRLDQISLERVTSLQRDRLIEPTPLGQGTTAEGRPLMLGVSSLRGLSLTTLDQAGDAGLTSLDRARLADDARAGRAVSRTGLSASDLLTDAGAVALRQDTARRETPQRATADDEYISILRRIAERYAGAAGGEVQIQPELLTGLDEQYQALRDELTGRTRRVSERAGATRETPAAAPTPPAGEGEQPDEGADETIDPGLFGAVLRHGETVEHYGADRDDRFNELMRTAEERMVSADFFWAERRFNRALRIIPGHPLATAGVVHAQIGAGLHLPAAITLRRLLTRNPEMIDVRYAEQMLPARDRLYQAVAELRTRVEAQIDPGPNGFVLAYIGHQLDDRDLIEEGLAGMSTDAADESFVALLRELWVAEE